MTTDTKGSALPSGGAVQTSDELIAVRNQNGTPSNVTVQLGTAAAKTASDNTQANVASVKGTIQVGHVATFADASGTLQDGGAPGGASGTAAAKAASDNTKASVASVSGSTNSGHVATFADNAGTVQDGGALATVATSGSYNDLANKPPLGSAAALAAGSAGGVATLDSNGKLLAAQIPPSLVGAVVYQGTWNAATNTPTLVSGTGTKGFYYKVAVAGASNVDGISSWNIGDTIIFDGTTWDKIDGVSSEVVSVAGRTGAVTLSAGDISGLGTAASQNVGAFAQSANNLSDLASASTALTNLLPSQSGNSGKVLTTSGSGVSWSTPSSSGSKPGAMTINVLSDSQGAQSIYQPGNLDISNVQTWQPSTAYISNEVVKYNGYLFYSPSAATSGTTPPTPAAPGDGTITWSVMAPVSNKFGNSILSWMEMWSDGRMVWNMDDGYKGTNIGLVKVIVVNGGSGYTNPTITPINGVKATVQQSGGVITSVTIQSPGRATGYFTLTISDPTGSGAVLSTVGGPSGTFGVSGCTSDDMVARLPDVLASNVDVMLVLFPTNDLTANYTYSHITGNLKTIIDTLAAAKKGVVIETGTPRTLLNQAQVQVLNRCNRWIRQYCQGNRSTGYNTFGYTNVALSDPTGYLTDATPSNTNLNWPIGGQSQSGNAVTIDGLHPNERGACIRGYCASQAASVFFPPAPAYPARAYSASDCYDPVQNPGGNRLEAMPWTASTAIVVGQSRANNGNVYFCTTAGTTASSGGPSGTGTSITDGSVVWTYAFPQFMSVLGSGTAGTIAAASGVTISGSLFTGAYLSRATGSASGSLNAFVESPWSNGQVGQRQGLTFTLGSGTATESWQLRLGYLNYNQLGILASDLGVTPFTFDMEVEITGAANLTTCYPYISGPNGATALAGPSSSGTGNHLPSSSGEPIALPPKMLIKSPPLIFPPNTTIVGLYANLGFDASGAAGSATATIKINKFGFSQAGIS